MNGECLGYKSQLNHSPVMTEAITLNMVDHCKKSESVCQTLTSHKKYPKIHKLHHLNETLDS
ncbi:hypothetical protein A7K99_11245 [Tatumella citrea]|uniref:Uncharacterized protein n=1 Tax=Tatumella citrea TaxID=53336 RepID=A0A1Y0L8N3_TATCI|nr:hypothetical protein A7K98_11245 [Tatumella citrea]ARU98337.1 hypothetical protein A7K99_11245 [Tatumella citrea]